MALHNQHLKSDRKNGPKVQSTKAARFKNKSIEPTYNHISIDVWFSIAEFVDPEDVRNFALICRQTAFVVTSAKFWFNLYRRFYKPNCLPDHLEKYCLHHVGSLRSKVICALFHLYPPFIERIKNGYDISFVSGYMCTDSWCKKGSNVWLFCYRFWNSVVSRRPREDCDDCDDTEDTDGLSGALNKINNVFENPHEGKYLLVICSKRYVPFPALKCNNMILHSTRQPIASDLKSINLELKFVPPRQPSAPSLDVVYLSILKYRIYPWWHPDFNLNLLSTLNS